MGMPVDSEWFLANCTARHAHTRRDICRESDETNTGQPRDMVDGSRECRQEGRVIQEGFLHIGGVPFGFLAVAGDRTFSPPLTNWFTALTHCRPRRRVCVCVCVRV